MHGPWVNVIRLYPNFSKQLYLPWELWVLPGSPPQHEYKLAFGDAFCPF